MKYNDKFPGTFKHSNNKKISLLLIGKFWVVFLLIFAQSCKSNTNPSATFKDKFTGEKIEAKLLTGNLSNFEPDGILYFEKNGKIYERVYSRLTPEMFGAKGDGKTDDYAAIQKMLDSGKSGCTFWFTKGKTYYNAFANNGKWQVPEKRNIWTRTLPATFLFNGAKLRRRIPQWNDLNTKSNYNTGQFYTDEQSSILYLKGENFIIDGADFSSNIPLGNMRDDHSKLTGNTDYAVSTGMSLGLWLDHCKNVKITNSTFSNTVFPVYITSSSDITLDKVNLKYAAQAYKRISVGDPATGAGMKMIKSQNIIATNIYGYRNANATVEVESLNRNVTVQGMSEYDYDTSMTIISSENVKIDWVARNVVHGSGLLIVGTSPNEIPTRNISGKIDVHGTVWCGVLVWLKDASTNDISNVDLVVNTSDNGHAGVYLNNESKTGKKITGLNINHKSVKDGWGDGFALKVNNAVQGKVQSDVSGVGTAVRVQGKNTRNDLQVKLKADRSVNKQYEVDASAAVRKL